MSISKIKVGSTEHDLHASKLTTARTIGLGTGATGTATSFDGSANITIPVTSVKEAYLEWGGKSIPGGVSPIGASLSSEHSANRLAYLNPNALSFEYSDDASSLPTREAISVPNTNHTHSVTASGTIGNTTTGGTITSTFSGTEATISHTFTPAGSISKTSITPAGTVSRPTFTGTGANHNHTFTGSAVNSSTES